MRQASARVDDGTPPRRLPTDRHPIFCCFPLPFSRQIPSHPSPATNLLRLPLGPISISSRFPISIPVCRPLRHPLPVQSRSAVVAKRARAGVIATYLIHCAPGNHLDSCASLLSPFFSSINIRLLCLLSVLPLRYPSRSSDCDLCDELSN
ncbi:hypothetical protein CKAH01_12370 [Colletotrichum kahawae]|uniref:Uncharacterized protein n=1 Tax=Colletotrichum kahawae TaxID=34407 RepID=A0AAD9YSH7_COLKA|nr:hypothetical protein CKAH01_12370 [Colletotrichum kahawae]